MLPVLYLMLCNALYYGIYLDSTNLNQVLNILSNAFSKKIIIIVNHNNYIDELNTSNRFHHDWAPHMIEPTRLSPHDCAHTRLCPHTIVPTHDCAHTHLCPETFVPRHDCAQT